MHEPTNIIPLEPFGEDDVIAHALDLISHGGIDAIERAFDELDAAGIDPAEIAAQPVLIEAIVQLMDALEQDLAKPHVHSLILRLDPKIAEAAGDLLLIANVPDGSDDLSILDDGTVLLLAGLRSAGNKRPQAIEILRQVRIWRPAPRFQRGAVQLLLLVQQDSDAVIEEIFAHLLDGRDHPEIWPALPVVIAHFPDLKDKIGSLTQGKLQFYTELWGIVHALCIAAAGDPEGAIKRLEPIATDHSQSTLAQGAFFHITSLLSPSDPAHDLSTRFCTKPFETIDIPGRQEPLMLCELASAVDRRPGRAILGRRLEFGIRAKHPRQHHRWEFPLL